MPESPKQLVVCWKGAALSGLKGKRTKGPASYGRKCTKKTRATKKEHTKTCALPLFPVASGRTSKCLLFVLYCSFFVLTLELFDNTYISVSFVVSFLFLRTDKLELGVEPLGFERGVDLLSLCVDSIILELRFVDSVLRFHSPLYTGLIPLLFGGHQLYTSFAHSVECMPGVILSLRHSCVVVRHCSPVIAFISIMRLHPGGQVNQRNDQHAKQDGAADPPDGAKVEPGGGLGGSLVVLLAQSSTAAHGLRLNRDHRTVTEEVEEGLRQEQELGGRVLEKGRLGLVRLQLVLQLKGVEFIFAGEFAWHREVRFLFRILAGARDASHGVF